MIAPAGSTFTTPHTTTPKEPAAQQRPLWPDDHQQRRRLQPVGRQELTRWRSDQTCDAMGTFCYIHEAIRIVLWSNTWHPVGGKIEGYSVDFALGPGRISPR
jgi:cyclic beta-1,2-glucan synthetase